MGGLMRTRWAAVGAAVAVALGAGGISLATAANGGDNAAVTVIAPCRLMDTRPAPDNVGPRNTPLLAAQTYTTPVHGSNGNCVIPEEAVGVILNVTVVGGTGSSYLTVWPSDATRPLASNLNWAAGQNATANQVTAKLSADGELSFYNNRGSVNVIADITGYFADHDHDDRYYTEAEVDQAVDTAVAGARCGAEPRRSVDLSQCDLAGANLSRTDLTDANFTNANLSDVRLDEANLTDAVLAQALVAGAELVETNFYGADLTGANFTDANFTDADLTNADLTGATLTNAYFAGTVWENTTCPDGTSSEVNGNTCEGINP